MSDAIYRRAVAADAGHITLLGQATFLESYAGLVDGSDIFQHCRTAHAQAVYEQWLNDPATSIWLAETEAMPVPIGYVVLSACDLPVDVDASDVEIKRFYLLHRFQNAGIGRGLLECALEEARGRGQSRVLLGVYTANRQAVAFYRKAGFSQVGVRQFQVGGSLYDDLVLARSLR